ncbi:MAG: MarR family transcriptional regulator [Quadrisphaera sp.]
MDPSQQRLVTKVARLYHVRGLRQAEIAARLNLSQSRVSRLLSQAEEAGVVRTVVVVPPGPHSDLEDALEVGYDLAEVHVVDVVADDEEELVRDLGQAAAAVFAGSPLRGGTLGYTSWSRTLRHCVDAMVPQTSSADVVVETLGDLGAPTLQHAAAQSTERLAQLLGAEPLYLRAPGVVSDPHLREVLLGQDGHARATLAAMDAMDVVLVGTGPADVAPPLGGDNFFSAEQFALARSLGAVGQVCLHFLDAEGQLLPTPLDDLVIGATAEQLRRTPRRVGVAGGAGKAPAIRAALVGGWVNVLVTDTETAQLLAASAPRR